jgi:molybdenum cofactor cytidylyltransferase
LITGIILASGSAKRMQREKLLLDVGGKPIVERVISTAADSLLDEVILIYRRDEIKEIAKHYSIRSVYNGRSGDGQSAALKLGITMASPNTDAFMFLVGDQPFLNVRTINILIELFKEGTSPIIVPSYQDRSGNPVIFSSALKEDLLGIEGDCGGRILIERMPEQVKLVPIKESIEGLDVDTLEIYNEIQRLTDN